MGHICPVMRCTARLFVSFDLSPSHMFHMPHLSYLSYLSYRAVIMPKSPAYASLSRCSPQGEGGSVTPPRLGPTCPTCPTCPTKRLFAVGHLHTRQRHFIFHLSSLIIAPAQKKPRPEDLLVCFPGRGAKKTRIELPIVSPIRRFSFEIIRNHTASGGSTARTIDRCCDCPRFSS